jgi:hypothetical protein
MGISLGPRSVNNEYRHVSAPRCVPKAPGSAPEAPRSAPEAPRSVPEGSMSVSLRFEEDTYTL